MTFETAEESNEGGAPVELYKFVYGGVAGSSPPPSQYLFNNADENITDTAEALTYTPLAISRDNIRSNGTLDHATITLQVPEATDLADLFLVFPPPQPVTLQIRQGHIGETDYPVAWTGRIVGAKRVGGVCELSAQGVATALARAGLRRRYSLYCPYVLYDPDTCKASEAAVTLTGISLTSFTGQTLTVPSGWNGSVAVTKYNGGRVKWTNETTGLVETRRILSATTTSILIAGLIRGLTAGVSPGPLTVIPGCNRRGEDQDCQVIHNNINNFGGFEYLPQDNPHAKNNFY